jgi:2-oxoglutarate ferredoxin oxidoreductase subunit gamma
MKGLGRKKRLEIRFAGIGGQGLQAAATVIGKSLIRSSNLYVCQTQNYGPESRGGLSYADLIISKEEIDFPKIKTPNVLICMSNASYVRFKNTIFNGVLSHLIIDPEMVFIEDIPQKSSTVQVYRISATLTSEAIFGNRIGSNMVLVGALHAILEIGNTSIIERTLAEEWPLLADKNIAAFRKGIALVQGIGAFGAE